MRGKDLTLLILSGLGMALALAPLILILGEELVVGVPVLLERGISFLTDAPPLPGRGLGGVGTVIQGTVVMVGLGSLIGIPISFFSGFYMYEFPNDRLATLGRSLIDMMVEFPTIIVGVVVFLLLVVPTGKLSALAGATSLAIIEIPYVATGVHSAFESLPKDIREGAYALGLKRWDVMKVLIGAAKSGILTSILIGVSKIAGETAPLLFTTTTSFNLPFRSIMKPVGAIPVLIYIYAASPYENWHLNAWGASLVLTLIIIAVYLPTRFWAKR